MNELYFEPEEFRRELVENYQTNWKFRRVNFELKKLLDSWGTINLFFYSNAKIAELSIDYDVFKSQIFIHDLHVNFPRRGIGRRIVSGLEETSKKFGFGDIELTPEINAVKFWEKMGYLPCRTEDMAKHLQD